MVLKVSFAEASTNAPAFNLNEIISIPRAFTATATAAPASIDALTSASVVTLQSLLFFTFFFSFTSNLLLTFIVVLTDTSPFKSEYKY